MFNAFTSMHKVNGSKSLICPLERNHMTPITKSTQDKDV